MIFKRITLLSLFCLITLLGGCTTLPSHTQPLNQSLDWKTRQQLLHNITEWQIEGAIAIHTPKQSFSASLHWNQQSHKNQYTINLFGPLGIGAIVMKSSPSQFTLFASNRQTFTAQNPEALLQQQLNWHLPISNLHYWIRGLPAPNLPCQKQFDHYNHLTILKQQDWTIHYRQYTSTKDIDLPSKISLQSDSLRLKIIISDWEIPSL